MALKMKILWLALFCTAMALALWVSLAARTGPEYDYPALSVPPFGQVLVTIVEARGLRPPADDSLRVYEPDVDWAWGGSWRCRGICWRGLCWQRRLLLWSVRPDDAAMASAAPQWRSATTSEVPSWSADAAEPRCLTPQLLALAVVLALLRWRRSAMQPAVRALRRLRRDSAADIPADELAQIIRAGLGGAWDVPVPAGANVSPALTAALPGLLAELVTQLDRERYAGAMPTSRQRRSRLDLARHCLELARALPAADVAGKTRRKGNGLRPGRDISARASGGGRS